MSPQHFHAIASIGLAAGAIWAGVNRMWAGALFIALGAGVAVVHWKAAKAGIIENE